MELKAREGSPVSQGRWILRRVTLTLHHGSHLAAASARVSPAPLVRKWGRRAGCKERRLPRAARNRRRGAQRPGPGTPCAAVGGWRGGGPGTGLGEEEQEEEPGQARSVRGFREAAAGWRRLPGRQAHPRSPSPDPASPFTSAGSPRRSPRGCRPPSHPLRPAPSHLRTGLGSPAARMRAAGGPVGSDGGRRRAEGLPADSAGGRHRGRSAGWRKSPLWVRAPSAGLWPLGEVERAGRGRSPGSATRLTCAEPALITPPSALPSGTARGPGARGVRFGFLRDPLGLDRCLALGTKPR